MTQAHPTQKIREEDDGEESRWRESMDSAPPSPFLLGWKSVNPKDYPYAIPSIQKTPKPKRAIPKGPLPQTAASVTNHPVGGRRNDKIVLPPIDTSKITTAAKVKQHPKSSTQSTANHDHNDNLVKSTQTPPQRRKSHIPKKPPNTSALFIPKPKKPLPRNSGVGLSLETVNANSTAQKPDDSIRPPNTSIVSPNDLNKDPYADWGSPQKEKEVEMEEGNQQNGAEKGQEKESNEESSRENAAEKWEEIAKPLKLDRNLLEIIIRMVLVKIKLIESSEIYQEIHGVLTDFKQQTRGLYKTHSTIFQTKLTQAVNKVIAIESEYDKVSSTIDPELKSSITNAVKKHKNTLNALNPQLKSIFGDAWSPKPVIYLDSTTVSSSSDPVDRHLTFDQPAKTSLHSGLRQEPNQTSNDNNSSDNPWSWGDDTQNATSDPKPSNESENKSLECPWGVEEPEETTSKPSQAQPGSTTVQDDSFDWGGGGHTHGNNSGDTWATKSNHHDSGRRSNQNFGNDSGAGWNDETSNPTTSHMYNTNSFESRPRDSGWGGMRNGRGGRGGGFSHDQSGFRGRGRGFGGDRGFRGRGGGDSGGYGGWSRGSDGGGFRGRGRGFGNNNGFSGGNSNGFGDTGPNNSWNDSSTGGFNGGNGNGFGDTSNSFNSRFNHNDNNRTKGEWGDSWNNSQSGGFSDTGNGRKSAWGDVGVQNGFGNVGSDNKAEHGGGSNNGFKSGWEDSGNDFKNESNAGGKVGAGGGEGQGFKTAGGGGFGTLGSRGREGCEVPQVPSPRSIIQYDTIAPESVSDGNDWGVTNGTSSATVQPSQLNSCQDNQARNISTSDDNGKDNNSGWGSPPPKEQVEISSSVKHFTDLDGAPTPDDLHLKLDYGGEMLVDKMDVDLNTVKSTESIEKACETDPNNHSVQGNEERPPATDHLDNDEEILIDKQDSGPNHVEPKESIEKASETDPDNNPAQDNEWLG